MAVTLSRAQVGAPHAAQLDAERATRCPRWIHRQAVDVAMALCWIPFAVAAHALEVDGARLTTFVSGVFLLSFAHQPLTLALVYGDREQFELRRAIFAVSPFVFVLAVVVALHVSVLALAIVAGLWNAEHTLMQRYGITRIYGRKAGQKEGRLERALLVSWLVLAVVRVASDPSTPARLRQLDMGGTNELAVRTLTRFATPAGFLVLPALAVAAGVALAWLAAERRRGAAANPAKWIYVASTAALFGVILIDPIAGLMGFVGAHSLEYFVIVHQSLGTRYRDGADPGSAPARSPLGRAVRAPTGRLGFLAAYLALILSIVALLEWRGSADAYLVVFFTLGGLHVFYDGFIWKLRRPAVARSLGLTGP
ncbi:MAG TPA: hypothetical protein VMT43_10205 [Acidimicrobiales bacterium]|nr:hypothetical protein [Acidimicrobiales bacterium]